MPSIAEAFTMAGRLYAAGNLPGAEQQAWAILSVEPTHAESLRMIGVIAHQTGDLGKALDFLNRSLLCNNARSDTWKNRGDLYLATGDARSAISDYEQALRLQPIFVDAFNNIGVAFQQLGQFTSAVNYFQEAIRLRPSLANAHNNLGNVLREQGKLADAGAAYAKALELAPDYADAAYNFAICLHEQGELDQAVTHYRHALRLNPNWANAYNNLGSALKEQGLLDEAIGQFQEALKHAPEHALAIYNLSELAAVGQYVFPSSQLETMKASVARETVPPLERSLVGFALATVYNKQGNYDEAFAYCREANELRRGIRQEGTLPFDPEGHRALVERIVAAHDDAYFQSVRDWGTDTDMPIFIIGMPRSGTTLVEQILASHPLVFGAGEIDEVPRFSPRFATRAAFDFYTDQLLPTMEAARALAADYLKYLGQLGKGAGRVTVKTLENVFHLGVIATLFPRAHIIHCRRDPLDTCVSCYFQNFREIEFAWSLEDIGAYYCAYEKLMAHWGRVLPLSIHEVVYEQLIHDQETVTRDLLGFCGLDWDERCLNFFNTRRVVRTASSVQVRKPMTAKAIGRWILYRAHLGPLFKALGRFADKNDYRLAKLAEATKARIMSRTANLQKGAPIPADVLAD
jgi:tetratricopeptide (TPR) repeat protein